MTINTTTIKPHQNIKVETYEFDPITKEPIRKLKSIHFGKCSLEQFSTPIIIKMNVKGIQKITNIKLGIIEASQIIQGSGIINDDNSMTIGNIGIEHSKSINPKNSLISFFPGINEEQYPSSQNNIIINNSSNTESEYIYINTKRPTTINRGFITFKWFFDFS